MTTRALRAASRQRPVRSEMFSWPAPVGGLNARDPIADMNKLDALQLDNFIPREDTVDLRKGYSSYATGMTNTVESLMPLNGLTNNTMLAAGNNALYEVTSSGAVGAAKASGFTNNRWQHITANNVLIMVNGADGVRQWNGTAVSTPSITEGGGAPTSFTIADFIHVNSFKERVFYIEKDTLGFVYMDNVEQIAGDASFFNLSYVARKGGYLMAMATWSRDGGAGLDDFAVFLTSEGEALVYQGTDPGSASTWSLVGIFDVPKPIGRRCFIQYGPDVYYISQDGGFLISQILGAAQNTAQATTDKIRRAFRSSYQSFGSTWGWQPIYSPAAGLILINVPETQKIQYVANTTTGSWCRFTGFDASCWAFYNNKLYFGSSGGIVYEALEATDDNGADIVGLGKTAFNYFGTKVQQKSFNAIQPVFQTNGTLPIFSKVNVDFDNSAIVGSPSTGTSGSTPWGSAWGSPWGSGIRIENPYVCVGAIGYSGAIRIKISTQVQEPKWTSTNVFFERGRIA